MDDEQQQECGERQDLFRSYELAFTVLTALLTVMTLMSCITYYTTTGQVRWEDQNWKLTAYVLGGVQFVLGLISMLLLETVDWCSSSDLCQGEEGCRSNKEIVGQTAFVLLLLNSAVAVACGVFLIIIVARKWSSRSETRTTAIVKEADIEEATTTTSSSANE